MALIKKTEFVELEEKGYDKQPEYETLGVVSSYEKLIVRKQPAPYGEIICEVMPNSQLLIEGEVGNWFYVCTEAGIEGYCRKESVSVLRSFELRE